MIRSPYNGRGIFDAGAGALGTEIETDVMRFMAILALCLVAIFALVQSLPEEPLPEPDFDNPAEATQPVAATQKVATSRQTQPEAATPQKPEPPPAMPAAAEPAPPPVVTSTAAKGLVLRFESDRALSRLVERDAVGLYAISAGDSHRLEVTSGRMSFFPASVPNAFHEMDPETVPVPVRRAIAAAGVIEAPVQWGVTLPAATSAELERILSVAESGVLIIDARGELRLEP